MEDAPKVRWEASLQYAAFVDLTAGTASIVSSQIVDEARGFTRGAIAVVVDDSGTFCDLEALAVTLAGETAGGTPTGSEPSVADSVVVLPSAPATGTFDGTWLVLAFGFSEAGIWRRVGRTGLFLRVLNGSLEAVAQRPALDSDGKLEAKWLDSAHRTASRGPGRTYPRRARPSKRSTIAMLTRQELALLELAAEDYYGLWEARWRLESLGLAPTDRSGHGPADVVRSLLNRGLIDLFVRPPGFTEPWRPDRAVDLGDPTVWAEPVRGDEAWLFAATVAGEETLRRGGRSSDGPSAV